MARPRKKVSPKLKTALIAEAGGKCANPGCQNRRTQLHHIREWHVWETHDRAHMIALCPSCHDAAHHGELLITDDELYRWKDIARKPSDDIRDHYYVEPGEPSELVLGNVGIISHTGFRAFDLSPSNQLGFRVVGGDIMRVNLTITTLAGQEALRVVDGDVKHIVQEDISYQSRRGRILVTTPTAPSFLPSWVPDQLHAAGTQPALAPDGRLVLLDMRVERPGEVHVLGIWADAANAVVATPEGVFLVTPRAWSGVSDLSFAYDGPITPTALGFS
jgi:hypothetical protein